MFACFLVLLVVADVEGVFDDEADYLRREVGEFRGERFGDGVEVVARVGFDAARRDHFLDVRVGRLRGGLSSVLKTAKSTLAPVDQGAWGTISQEMV